MAARDYRDAARASLVGKWGMGILLTFTALGVAGFCGLPLNFIQIFKIFPALETWMFSNLSNFNIFFAGMIIVLPVLNWSLTLAFLLPVRGRDLELKALTYGFHNFAKVWCLQFFLGLYTFLWSLLLIIPGIVKAYSYAMASYILADNPAMDANGAITRSRELMRGNKWRLFCLDLSFIGWGILACLSFGVGLLWLVPYQSVARAKFYDELSRADSQRIPESPVEQTPSSTDSSAGSENA
jgi:uncharacterized membrane protein